MEHKTNKKDKNEDGQILSDHEPSKKARITSQKELKRVAVALKRREGHGQFLEDRKVSKDSTGGIGRPKGDVGREFAKSGEIRSFAVTDDDAKKSEQQQQQRQRTFVAYGDKMKFEETASEQAHKRNVEVIKKLPESAKPSLIGEEKFDAKKKTKVPQSVRYKCLYRLVAIRLEEHKNEKDAEVITRLVNEASEREFDCFENSRDKQTYLSKVAQFKSSESFQNLKDLMHPKGAEKQNDSSETARKISLELCREVRGVESIKFFARAARRASGF